MLPWLCELSRWFDTLGSACNVGQLLTLTCEPKAPIDEVILLLRSKCPPHGFPLQPAHRREHLGEVLVSHPKFVIMTCSITGRWTVG